MTDEFKGELSLAALKVSQPIGTFFISSVKARDLVEISYVDVRRLVQAERDIERFLGIQRPVDKRRIKQIKKYLGGSDATFPTSIIIAVDSRCATFEATNGNCGLLKLSAYQPADDESDDKPIPYGQLAKVIDGQHRIASFMNDDEEYVHELFGKDDFECNVAVFIGADIADQANIFATVNLAQTKVNKSLVYDLTELAKARSPYKTCHNVAVILDREKSSPLHKRIKRLGVSTPGRKKETLTQAGFVEALVDFISNDPITDRNLLLDGYPLRKANESELSKVPFRNMWWIQF